VRLLRRSPADAGNRDTGCNRPGTAGTVGREIAPGNPGPGYYMAAGIGRQRDPGNRPADSPEAAEVIARDTGFVPVKRLPVKGAPCRPGNTGCRNHCRPGRPGNRPAVRHRSKRKPTGRANSAPRTSDMGLSVDTLIHACEKAGETILMAL
jgi:hypothetical protein